MVCGGWCVCVCCLRRRGWLTVAGWLRFACRRLASLLGRQHDAEVSGRFQGVSPCYRKLFRLVGRDGTGWDGMDPASPVRGCWPCPFELYEGGDRGQSRSLELACATYLPGQGGGDRDAGGVADVCDDKNNRSCTVRDYRFPCVAWGRRMGRWGGGRATLDLTRRVAVGRVILTDHCRRM